MTDSPASKLHLLSPRERECLVLVGLGLRSKEIAPILRIEPSAVDSTLKRAGRRVGSNDRKTLARLLQEHEPEMVQSLVQRLGQRNNPLVAEPIAPPTEVAAAVDAGDDRRGRWWLVPTVEREWNELSAWQKRAWAIVIAFGLLTSGGALIAAARMLLRVSADQ